MTTGRVGRPRSEDARRAVLEAARDLLATVGFESLSIESIAQRAGVGKQTIYRWWRSKALVIAEAALDGTIPPLLVPVSNSGDLRRDLESWLGNAVVSIRSPQSSALIRALASAVAADEDASAQLYSRFTEPSRHALIQRMEVAIDDEQVRRDADIAAAVDALISVNLFAVLARDPLTTARADGLLNVLLSGIGPRAT